MFSPITYQNRRKQLRESVGSGLILLMGNEESPMNYADNVYHFRQDSSFLYYVGLDTAGLAYLMDCDSGEEWLVGEELTIDHIVWMGKLPGLGERAEQAGIYNTMSFGKLAARLGDTGAKVHFLPPYRSRNMRKLQEWLGVNTEKLADEASLTLVKAVIAQRSYKSAEEVVEIEKAVKLTTEMHRAAMLAARPGIKEYEVLAAINERLVRGGGEFSFPPIVSVRGEILHNHSHGNTLQDGQLLLVDTGAQLLYAGDMTRTVPVNPKFNDRQKDIYTIVNGTLDKAIASLKPGVAYKDIHLEAARNITIGLKELGLMKGDVDDAVKAGAHAMFFPTGLGHMMGLDVHDMEDLGELHVGYAEGEKKSTQFGLKSLRLGRTLEPGFVLTVEPGIYFVNDLIDLWRSEGRNEEFINFDKLDAWRDFGGIRIEDDLLITENGHQLLGEPLPRSVEELEALRKG